MTPQTATQINKALAALAIAASLAATTLVFPSFGPNTEANAASAAGKSDRFDIATRGPGCAEQNWPNFNSKCLTRTESHRAVVNVRMVTTDHR